MDLKTIYIEQLKEITEDLRMETEQEKRNDDAETLQLIIKNLEELIN